jgi:hypothetical protein
LSHFIVMVIGNDVETQLAPFHEFECTGTDDKYVKDIDVTDSMREDFEKYGKDFGASFAEFCDSEGKSIVAFGSCLDLADKHKYGYTLLEATGEVASVIDRTNPDRKWDWWVIGGRWSGFLKLRSGAMDVLRESSFMTPAVSRDRADQAFKRDIDFDGIRDDAEKKARASHRRFHAILAGRELPRWDEIRERHSGNIDAARQEYNGHPVIQEFHEKDRDWEFFEDKESYLATEDEYARLARDRAITTFAFVRDGKWFEKGRMGSWACVSGEMDQDEWNRRFAQMLDGLPEDTLLTIVDCHI